MPRAEGSFFPKSAGTTSRKRYICSRYIGKMIATRPTKTRTFPAGKTDSKFELGLSIKGVQWGPVGTSGKGGSNGKQICRTPVRCSVRRGSRATRKREETSLETEARATGGSADVIALGEQRGVQRTS